MTSVVSKELRPFMSPTCARTREQARRDFLSESDEARRSGRDKQYAKGKRHALERIEMLLDDSSFQELERFAGQVDSVSCTDGVIYGYGTVHGQRVMVFSQDFTVMGGTIGARHAKRISKCIDMAVAHRIPVIGLFDSGGARIQQGATSLDGCGAIFRSQVRASGVIPQISVILGPCAGAASYAPALTDFVFMVEMIGNMYLTGPSVVQKVTGEEITAEELGGTTVHAEQSGVAHFSSSTEEQCFDDVRYLISLLPPNSTTSPETLPTDDLGSRRVERLYDLVPADYRQPYDVLDIIDELFDGDTFLEVSAGWAKNVVCGFARIDGRVAGIVANQPAVLAGTLTIDAADKSARFIRFCDAFNIPIITLVDVPGFLPGRAQESGGIIRHGAKMLYAYCEASVPRIQVIMRKAYGGGYIVMDSLSLGADLSFAWPTTQIAVMGSEAAVDIVHRREIAEADDAERRRMELVESYEQEHLHLLAAEKRGLVHQTIDPGDTRIQLITGLAFLEGKRPDAALERKHGNVPM